jgi:hypothetical protein
LPRMTSGHIMYVCMCTKTSNTSTTISNQLYKLDIQLLSIITHTRSFHSAPYFYYLPQTKHTQQWQQMCCTQNTATMVVMATY